MSIIQKIRDYTAAHEELCRAHHFLFDLPSSDKSPRFVLMGLNPGESPKDAEYKGRSPINEETREYDFRASPGYTNRYGKKVKREETKWTRRATVIGGSADFVQTEYFFWSSKNLGTDFFDRFGTTLGDSSHIGFCVEMNKSLLAEVKPAFVIVTSLSYRNRIAESFNLKLVDWYEGRFKAFLYNDSEGLQWFFVPHLTGARGFGHTSQVAIGDYVRSHTNA